jgi:DNA-binding transcriptional MerR regulator
MADSFTLTDIARRLDVPQHRLIHLCEKGVVVPEVHEAAGRGSSRVFSSLNFLELAVALRLRDMFLPVSAARGIVHVLRTFGEAMQGRQKNFSLVEHLRNPGAPDLRVILSDGQAVYFTLGPPDVQPRLFGGVSLDALIKNEPPGSAGEVAQAAPGLPGFGGPEGSQFARMELSVSAIAQSLPLE